MKNIIIRRGYLKEIWVEAIGLVEADTGSMFLWSLAYSLSFPLHLLFISFICFFILFFLFILFILLQMIFIKKSTIQDVVSIY